MDRQVIEFFKMLVTAIIIAAIISLLLTLAGVRIEDGTINEYQNNNEDRNFNSVREQQNRRERRNHNQPSNSLIVLPDESNAINIPISPMREFSGLKVDTILKAREEAIKTSPVFKDISYTPDPNIYRIVDGKPWIGAYEISCHGIENNPNLANGDSRESLAILNPEILMPITIGSANFNERNHCSEIDYMLPTKMVYDPISKTIVTHINYTDYKNKNGFLNIVPNDQNARDLGYNYVYMDSLMNIAFKYPENNVSNNIVQTHGYYMHGGACGLPGGCNNNAPYISEYEFYLNDLPAIAHFKLWKRRPISVNQKADFNYIMMFE